MANCQRSRRLGTAWWLSIAVLGLVACRERPSPQAVAHDSVPPASGGGLFLASAQAALPPPGVTPADLPDSGSAAAKLVGQYCTACHALPSPQTHSATDWPVVVRRMWLRIDRVAPRYEVPVPSTAERMVILPYLIENALQVSGDRLPAAPGRELFQATCSQCHDLPDPAQHSPADWATVVRRMTEHREQMLGVTTSRSDLEQIILYLERASAPRAS